MKDLPVLLFLSLFPSQPSRLTKVESGNTIAFRLNQRWRRGPIRMPPQRIFCANSPALSRNGRVFASAGFCFSFLSFACFPPVASLFLSFLPSFCFILSLSLCVSFSLHPLFLPPPSPRL